MSVAALPADIVVLERGWLSSNNILLCGGGQAALVDSGYGTHAAQTVALVDTQLGGRPLDLLLNTHLHSDHCGGNAALQKRYPGMRTQIPPGHAPAVAAWNELALSYEPTGQFCPRFSFDAVLTPGSVVTLGARPWEVHAAPGHDPHSVILFQPDVRVLISADALWAQGFGVVFPELEGISAFQEVGATLELIAALQPELVIPGHGAPFPDVQRALLYARRRLDQFLEDPRRHARYAAKVLLKFKLLEAQRIVDTDLKGWVDNTRYFSILHAAYFPEAAFDAWLEDLAQDLIRTGAAQSAIISGQRHWLNC